MEEYPKSVTKRCTQTILDQMNNNFIYKLKKKMEIIQMDFFVILNIKIKIFLL